MEPGSEAIPCLLDNVPSRLTASGDSAISDLRLPEGRAYPPTVQRPTTANGSRPLKLVYVGDFRDLPNWGCRSTGAALGALLSTEHEIIDRIALETLQDTGAWDRYAKPGIRYGGVVPRGVFNRAWKRRTAHPRAYSFYRKLESALGAKFDFVTTSPEQSVRDFHKARGENNRLQEIYEAIGSSDAIVVNGEGTMIFSNPPRRDVLFTLFLLALAYELGKKVYFLNAMFSECPSTGINEETVATAVRLLETASAVVVRDRQSYDFLTQRSERLPITILPDALFTWRDRVRSVGPLVGGQSGTILPFGFERLLEKVNFDEPYICIAGSSSAHRKGSAAAIDAYATLYEKISEIGLKTYLVATCSGDNYLERVARKTGATVIPWAIPVLSGAGVLANARLFVSGRFHPSIMASLGGTPCIFLGSNSHKTLSLQRVLEYPEERMFSDLPSETECGTIKEMAKKMISDNTAVRARISKTTEKRAQQAATVKHVLDGVVCEPVL